METTATMEATTTTTRGSSSSTPSFSVPASLPDLEGAPWHLLPYPADFSSADDDDDDNDTDRAEAFANLLLKVQGQATQLSRHRWALFLKNDDDSDANDDDDVPDWLDATLLQALYTLTRKSASLVHETRLGLIQVLADVLTTLTSMLNSATETVPDSFRNAWAAHLYMTTTFCVLLETTTASSSEDTSATTALQHPHYQYRQVATTAMQQAATCMANESLKTKLWRQGVPDEAVLLLPCKMAWRLLEASTGMTTRKVYCGDAAIAMVAATAQDPTVRTTVTAALVDLLHNHEHMAGLVTEICQATPSLAPELLQEVGRLRGSGDSKTQTGLKHVAPFLGLVAAVQPAAVLAQLPHLTGHLQSEPYQLRSAVVTAVGHVIAYLQQQQEQPSPDAHAQSHNKTTVAALLDLLVERVHDASSFTRSTVLKTWILLIPVLPKHVYTLTTRLALDRLSDKTVLVRKQAMQLLTALLENNPFLGSLNPEPYRQKHAQLCEYVQAHLPASLAEAHQEALQDADPERLAELKEATLQAAIAEGEAMAEQQEELTESQQDYCRKIQALQFTQSALDFIQLFEEGHLQFAGMLASANTSDVTEALRFFVKARHFQLPIAVTGMKRALALMWSTEANIRTEVLKAFCEVFIAEPGTDGTVFLPHNQIAKNLLVLVGQATVSEVASVEEAVVRLVKEERIPAQVFLILWSIASGGSNEARAAAFTLLSMGAAADASIVDSKSRLKLLLDSGLDHAMERNDWKLVSAAVSALQRVGRAAKVDPTDAKYLVQERILEALATVCRGDSVQDSKTSDTLHWFSASEQAIKALFVVSPEPEKACHQIISAIYQRIRGDTACHSLMLARFFHVLGHMAMHLLVYTEALSGSVRRANAKQSLQKQEAADKQQQQSQQEENAIEAELGMAAELEAENERNLAEIAENEIVGRGLLGSFAPLVVRVVSNEGGRYQSDILMQSACLALCKFMCVSCRFCETYLPLLFTALQKAPKDTTMRANTVIALGDLAFRFPNEVEPYTPRLYACLRDSSTKVRRHTLMVLTHLILNDMVKVKGQVCEIALCLRDDDSRIRDLSRLLFFELSKRSNNPVYNLLPDMISQLSAMRGDASLGKEDFRSILSFLLSFIKKDRQHEMLTEKLLLRFPKCTDIQQQADLAFCLAQLKMNEKSVKYLSDHFKLYAAALFDEDVKKSFLQILVKTKKFSKPELRQLLQEWEQKLTGAASMGAENQLAQRQASRAKARASRRKQKKGLQQKVVEPSPPQDDDDLDFDGDDEKEKENAPRRRSTRAATVTITSA